MTYVFQFGIVFDNFPRTARRRVADDPARRAGDAARPAGRGRLRLLRTSGPKPVRSLVDGLRRGDPQHAVPGAAVLLLLRAAGHRPALVDADTAALIGDGRQPRRLRDRDRPRRHRVDPARARSRPAWRSASSACRSSASIILKPALQGDLSRRSTSQFILLMLSSAVVSVISADDLTAVADNLQSQTFRSFEIYIVVDADLPRAGARVLAAVRADLLARASCADAERRRMRTFGFHEFLFILEAARWTLRAVADRLRRRRCSAARHRARAHLRQSRRCASRPPASSSCSRARRC